MKSLLQEETCAALEAGNSVFPGMGARSVSRAVFIPATAAFPKVGTRAWFRAAFVAQGSPRKMPRGL